MLCGDAQDTAVGTAVVGGNLRLEVLDIGTESILESFEQSRGLLHLHERELKIIAGKRRLEHSGEFTFTFGQVENVKQELLVGAELVGFALEPEQIIVKVETKSRDGRLRLAQIELFRTAVDKKI